MLGRDSLASIFEAGQGNLFPLAYLVVTSKISRVIHGGSHLSVRTSASHVVPQVKALMTLPSVTLGSLLRSQEKHWMYSRRVSPSFCMHLRRYQEFSKAGVPNLEVLQKGQAEVGLVAVQPGSSYLIHALVELDRGNGRY